jgi:hypothetical protein
MYGRVAVVSALLAAGLGLAACGTNSTAGTTPAPTTTASLSPADALTHAFAVLKTTGFDATVTEVAQGATLMGSVDYTHQSVSVTASVALLGQTLQVAALKVGSDMWVKIDLGDLARASHVDKTKWYLTDPSKLQAGALPFDVSGGDPFGFDAMFTSVNGVRATDTTHLTGTVDLTKATGPLSPDKQTLSEAGAAATAVPFAATLDDQGRLTELKTTPSGAGASLQFDIAISHYGSPTPISAPSSAEIIPATADVYTALNGLTQ